ncbi:MAG: translation initiation factor IF-2 [Bacteroidales bacterium]|nr:translation initiation factor IF-2 [Bacteroidales bacterium]
MPEGNKSIRLQKAAKEFNVGITTIVEFLTKKGKKVENSPNAKLDEESYGLLSAEFQSEKQKKDIADNLQISISKKNEPKDVVAKEDFKEVKTESSKSTSASEDIIVKSSTLDFKNSKAKKKETKETSEPEKEETVAVKPVIEEDNEPKSIKVGEQQINILGKIDLSSLNTKTKPDKKSKEKKDEKPSAQDKKKEKKDSRKDKKQDKKKEKADLQKTDKTADKQEEVNIKQEVKEKETKTEKEIQPADVKQSEAKPQEKQDNFIQTTYVKLTGPKLTGEKVDLSQFEHMDKKKDASVESKDGKDKQANKKKRKRIKTAVGTAVNKEGKNIPQDKDVKKDKKKDRKKDKRKRVEIDNTEIEKQIKETLARLSPLGKSKTSKHRREKRQEVAEHHQMELLEAQEQKNVLKVTEFVTANELATMMNVPVTKIIASCMQLGMFVSINQRLDAEALQLIADEFGYKIEFVSAEVVNALETEEEEDREEDLQPRSPIVTVMGHVDHGKTSLLDYIRKTNVIAGEAGGITQHIGAYEVTLSDGRKITFLDTPGHEAFTAMRARGAKMTDIAIIVVACDDKIMPQTIEAINHAQAAGVPIIFALNKIDKPGADPERIKGELANMNLLVEDWGGKIQSQEISAKQGTNVDLLLEKVLLEAEMLDLKGNPNKRAKGTVIESSLDKGRGYVAKILVQDGTINQGDFVLAGATFGRVKAMYNERNQLMKSAGPSAPVLLLGLNGAPQAGDTFNVVPNEKEGKDLANKRLQLQREQGLRTQKHITLDEIGRRIAIGDFKQLDLIIKADVDGSVEALADSLLKLSTPEVQVNVIHKSVGQITESDVLLATASNAIIIGFQVRPSVAARRLAEQEEIDIRLYSIIYDAINELKDAIEGMLSPEIKEKVVANLEIKETFKISKVGTIAGCMCLDGKINKNTKVRVIRDGIVVYAGNLASLKRFKDEVKEVVSGQDCGLNIENFNDIKVGDIIEGYEEIEVKRTLK